MQHIYTNLCRSALIALTLLSGCSSDDDDGFENALLTGSWTVVNVTIDLEGITTDEWIGKTISFTQTTENKGAFAFPETPQETVWDRTGEWTTTTTDQFTRNDNIVVRYTQTSDGLTLTFIAPLRVPFACATGFCIKEIPASWIFTLKKSS